MSHAECAPRIPCGCSPGTSCFRTRAAPFVSAAVPAASSRGRRKSRRGRRPLHRRRLLAKHGGENLGSGGGCMTMPSTHHGRRHSRRLQTAVFFDLTDTADDAFDRAIEIMLVGQLTFAPLALGAVQAWSELIVIGIAALMALCLAIKLLRRPDVRFVWSWTYVPIVVFLALVAIQLSPLPLSVLKTISPHTAELKTSLLTSASVAPEHLSAMPLSFYPEGTLHDLRLLLAVATVYVVTLNVVRQARQIRRLLIAITVIGAIVALIAAAHLLLG